MSDPNTSAPPTAPAPTAPANLVLPPDILDEDGYLARIKTGVKVRTRTNYALSQYGSFDIVETTAGSPGGAQILAVIRYVRKIDQKILDEVTPILAAAQAKAAAKATAAAAS